MQRDIIITETDVKRLADLLAVAEEFNYKDRDDLKKLVTELERAKVVNSPEVPRDVVTMNSKVVIVDEDTQEEMVYTLVYPKDANVEAGRLSVFAPLGTAILGYREGDTIEWEVPRGTRRLRVKEVAYQPEAAGDYHL